MTDWEQIHRDVVDSFRRGWDQPHPHAWDGFLVLSWSGAKDLLYIHIRFTATLAGRPLTWDAVDLLRVSAAGKVLRRESFFDSVPIAATLLSHPRSWLAWWRSGVGPFTSRRRVLRRRPLVSIPATGGS